MRMEGAFQRLYAIKRLRPHLCDDPEVRTLFLDEARYAGLIRHANVVPVLDVGEDEAGPFLVMEYVQGLPLSQLLRARRRVPVQVVVRIGLQAARGLHAAHELRDHEGRSLELVHRDVSPANILLGFDGVVRLTDFGIAKALGRSVQTQTGILKGKFGYMAPEQLRFLPADRRSDLFALGVVLYELFTSSRLYASRGDQEGPRRILHEPPPDVGEERPDIPDSVVELLFALLSKDPAERPETAAAAALALEGTLADLVAEEGVMGLAHYMEAEFTAERDAMRARLAAAMEAAEVATSKLSADEQETLSAGGGPAGGRAPRRRAFAWAALLALAAGIAWVSLRPAPS
ncbi:MAG: serine/threonine protein kinase, partial [Deltaproteobacteria bacterium]|nr:serine/threonine protein kinase [Deltaproteobacteria bacterium]